jgi:V/A-type H+-transporting ATPase subunit A
MTSDPSASVVTSVAGPVVRARCERPVALGEIARVGAEGLVGEVIELEGQRVTLQVYEDTSGLAPGAPFVPEGVPLQVELGPGLLGSVFDGVQRPLEALARSDGNFLGRGRRAPALDRDRVWEFEPRVRAGDEISGGAVIGAVAETGAREHRVLLPPWLAGRVLEVASGPRRVDETVLRLSTPDGRALDLPMFHRWNVRSPRPVRSRLPAGGPLLTGQRVLDTFFPLARGSAAGMPGGFGTGKTVIQQQLCRWARADVIVYVGCGERGNEMTAVLSELPSLSDPRTGRPLSERTILVANTSNMPVAAREASIWTAVTMAEYYRDMGYDVAVLSDSTSRWAEALREISGRLAEMPAEEGYPSYLSSRLASFYERAGRVVPLGGGEGSVSLISAISPPGGDTTEPVTRHTRRYTRCFWTLDRQRAEARIFPAVSLSESDADMTPALSAWWAKEVSADWTKRRADALAFLDEAERIERTARLVGTESLPDREQFLLRAASLFVEGFLRQNAYDRLDSSCGPPRQVALLTLLLDVRDLGLAAVARGVPARELVALPILAELERAKERYGDDEISGLADLSRRAAEAFGAQGRPGPAPQAAL